MLHLKKNITDSILLGIWRIEEQREELLATLSRREWISIIDSIKSESRVLEILAVRVLLKQMVGEEKQISYTVSGKPYLADGSFHISISHTKEFVAVAINKNQPIGIDIEIISEKIKRVRSRVISQSEYVDPNNELVHLLLHWSAKEAMFKFLNVEGVDFRNNLFVEKFTPEKRGTFHASESRTEQKHLFLAHYIVEKEFVIVCLEKNEDDICC